MPLATEQEVTRNQDFYRHPAFPATFSFPLVNTPLKPCGY